jgi:hypothetical protein
LKKAEFRIYFASRKVEKSWSDLLATRRNDVVRAWEFLTKTPHARTELCYPMSDNLKFVTLATGKYVRWQLKLSLTDGSRIWYYVVSDAVLIEQIFTSHPNQTKK